MFICIHVFQQAHIIHKRDVCTQRKHSEHTLDTLVAH